MKEKIKCLRNIYREITKNDLYSIANNISYRLVLSILPLLIFVMTLINFFNIDGDVLLQQIDGRFPYFVYDIVEIFVYEVIDTRNISIMSFSLVIAIYTLSSGVVSIIKGINATYGNTETRSKMRVRIISIILVFIFTFALILGLLILIFGATIYNFLTPIFLFTIPLENFYLLAYIGIICLLIIGIIGIYKISINKKSSLTSLMPGALVTLIGWLLSSRLFDIYISNFSRYSTIYGGIGSVFLLMIWLNLICFILLVGSKINALLEAK